MRADFIWFVNIGLRVVLEQEKQALHPWEKLDDDDDGQDNRRASQTTDDNVRGDLRRHVIHDTKLEVEPCDERD